jgi:peroxiredoxin
MGRLLPFVLLGLAAFLLAGCGSDPSETSAGDGAGFVGGDGSIVIIDPDDRVAGPALTGSTLNGADFALADYRGDIVVLNVWASWCAPCRAEAPELQEVWEEVETQGVQFIGLNTRDSNTAARGFVDTMGLTFPSVEDTDGRLQLLFADSLPPQAIPSTLVIDREGQVAARALGKVSASTLRGMIEEVDTRG